MWLWVGCYSLLLEPCWVRGIKKADVVWVRVRYSQVTTETSLNEQVS
jgi:hypothetical protein